MTHASSTNNVKLLAFKQFVAMADVFVVSICHRLLIRMEGLNAMVSMNFEWIKIDEKKDKFFLFLPFIFVATEIIVSSGSRFYLIRSMCRKEM